MLLNRLVVCDASACLLESDSACWLNAFALRCNPTKLTFFVYRMEEVVDKTMLPAQQVEKGDDKSIAKLDTDSSKEKSSSCAC